MENTTDFHTTLLVSLTSRLSPNPISSELMCGIREKARPWYKSKLSLGGEIPCLIGDMKGDVKETFRTDMLQHLVVFHSIGTMHFPLNKGDLVEIHSWPI